MDKIAVMCEEDRILMQEFSRRSLEQLHRHSLITAVLSFFSAYVENNVNKEIEKDRLIIREAAEAWQSGQPLCNFDLEEIFEKTKTVDNEFLRNIALPAFSVSIRYGDIFDIRIRRIWRISKTVFILMKNWTDAARLRDIVKKSFTENQFRAIILEILHLYIEETRMLSDSIRSPFRKTARRYLDSFSTAMEQAAQEMTVLYTEKIYGDKTVHA